MSQSSNALSSQQKMQLIGQGLDSITLALANHIEAQGKANEQLAQRGHDLEAHIATLQASALKHSEKSDVILKKLDSLNASLNAIGSQLDSFPEAQRVYIVEKMVELQMFSSQLVNEYLGV